KITIKTYKYVKRNALDSISFKNLDQLVLENGLDDKNLVVYGHLDCAKTNICTYGYTSIAKFINSSEKSVLNFHVGKCLESHKTFQGIVIEAIRLNAEKGLPYQHY